MIDNIMNEYGYRESGTDDLLMPHVLTDDNSVGYGGGVESLTEGSWPFDQPSEPNGPTPMATLDIMSFYKKEPTPPAPTDGPMYFEAVEANSTVSMISTLATAPNLEYSTDGVNFVEWEHTDTTEDDVTTHTFDTLTLGAIGDKVYFRGINSALFNILNEEFSIFLMTGLFNAGGSLTSLLDNDGVTLTEIPEGGLGALFASSFITENENESLITAPSLGNVVKIGDYGCYALYYGCTSLTTTSSLEKVNEIGECGCYAMYCCCISLASTGNLNSIRVVGNSGLAMMFNSSSISVSSNMENLTEIGDQGCFGMLSGCPNLTLASNMGSVEYFGNDACVSMYYHSNVTLVSDNNLTFEFPELPITAGSTTYSTAQEIAEWMSEEL